MRQLIVVNRSTVLTNEVSKDFVLGALQTQVTRDFVPLWGEGCQLGFTDNLPSASVEQIILADTSDQAGALGYHTTRGAVPVGFVFVKTTQDYGDHWTATLSHELLEQLVDPWCDFASEGLWKRKPALLALEMADAVENDEYLIGADRVSNFITPQWFNPVPSGPTDFMGTLKGKAFSLSKGGYTAYCTKLGQWQQAFGKDVPAHQQKVHPWSRRGRRWARSAKENRVAALAAAAEIHEAIHEAIRKEAP